jgi:predicted dehydrogenase
MHNDLTRRDFVRTSAGAAVAAPLLASVLLPRTMHAASWIRGDDRIRLGIVGVGGRGTGAAVQALRADPGCVLFALGDVFPDRAAAGLKAIREEMGDKAADKIKVTPETTFTGFDAYKKVIDSGVDAVLLTTYPAFRPAHIKYAIDAGKHVFAEKPLAVDAPGLRSVLASAAKAKEQNLGFLVGFCWRYNAGMRAAFDKINSGMIGDVLSVHTDYHTGTLTRRPRKPEWSDLEFQMRNWWHFTWLSGDHIVEQAIHSIDRLSWAMGDVLPVKCECVGGRAARSGPEHGNVFDHFGAVYEYADGRRCFHTTRQIDGCPSDNTDYIRAAAGSAVVEGWKPVYELRDRAGNLRWKFQGRIDDMYQVEHDEFFASIRAGKPINDVLRGANSTMLAMMARMAAYTGQTITWDKAMNSTESLVPETLAFGGPFPTPEVPIPGKSKFV